MLFETVSLIHQLSNIIPVLLFQLDMNWIEWQISSFISKTNFTHICVFSSANVIVLLLWERMISMNDVRSSSNSVRIDNHVRNVVYLFHEVDNHHVEIKWIVKIITKCISLTFVLFSPPILLFCCCGKKYKCEWP